MYQFASVIHAIVGVRRKPNTLKHSVSILWCNSIILARLQEHLKRGTIFVPVVPYSEIFGQVLFWVEVLLW